MCRTISMPILVFWFLWLPPCRQPSRLHNTIIKETMQVSAPSCISVGRAAKTLLWWVAGSNFTPDLPPWEPQLLTDSGAAQQCCAAGTSPQGSQLCPSKHCHKGLAEKVPLPTRLVSAGGRAVWRSNPKCSNQITFSACALCVPYEFPQPDFRESNKSRVKYSGVWRKGEMQDTDTKQTLSSLQNSK